MDEENEDTEELFSILNKGKYILKSKKDIPDIIQIYNKLTHSTDRRN